MCGYFTVYIGGIVFGVISLIQIKNNSNHWKPCFLTSKYEWFNIIFFTIEGFQLRGQLSQPNLCLVITKSQIRGRIMWMTPDYLCLRILIA